MFFTNDEVTYKDWSQLISRSFENGNEWGVVSDNGVIKDLSSIIPNITFFIENNIKIIHEKSNIKADGLSNEEYCVRTTQVRHQQFINELKKYSHVYSVALSREVCAESGGANQRLALKITGIRRSE
jgi:DNA-directed RNA polymerase subunit N (RpoN/RPB10)